MSASQSGVFSLQEFTDVGAPLVAGRLYTYTQGTTTHKTAYTDKAGSIAHTYTSDGIGGQYIGLNARGELPAPLYLAAGSYDITLKDSTGATIWTRRADPVDDSAAALGADLASTSGAGMVGFLQSGAGAVSRTLQDKMRESVSVKDFGAIGGGVINDTTAFNTAIAFCKLMGKGLKIPDDTYLLTAGAVNFAGQGLAIVGEGKPTLQFTGTGRAFAMDTLLSNGSVFSDMRVENLRIVGGPSITDGFYSRGIVRSVFRNIVVRECSAKAFHILHGVSNQYDSLKYSANEGAQITRPAYGVYITNNGAGYYTADCTFINCISEDFSLGVGCYVHDGSGNVFVGGTFEGCNIGLAIGEGCRRNHFISVWCEVNGTRDIEVNSTANTFDDCYFGSSSSGPNVEVGTGKGTVFRGGYIRTANLQSASSDTLFIGCGFDQNLSGTLGITGTGTYRVFSATKIDNSGNVVGNMDDKLGTVNGLTLSKGITFPATQVASSDANTLDDYEEGTWTGSLATGTSGTITMNSGLRTGSYIKIGRVVTVSGVFYVDSVSSPVGELSLTGLPFPANSGSSSSRAAAAVWASDLQATATTQIMGCIVSGESEIKLQKFASGSLSAMAADVKADSQFYISLTYVTNV